MLSKVSNQARKFVWENGDLEIVNTALKEVTSRVKSYLKHSKRGRVFNVKQYQRTTKAAAKMKIVGATSQEESYIRGALRLHDPKIVSVIPYIAVMDRKGFARAAKNATVPVGGSTAEVLAIYDEGRAHIVINRGTMEPYLWRSTLHHEVGHAAYFHSQNRPDWDSLYIHDKKFDRHTWYSKESVIEGFAESYMAYVAASGRAYNPKTRKTFAAVKRIISGVGKKNLYDDPPPIKAPEKRWKP